VPFPGEEIVDPPPELIELLEEQPGEVGRRLLRVALNQRREREAPRRDLDQDHVRPAVHADVRGPLAVPRSVRSVAGDPPGSDGPRLRVYLLQRLEGVPLNEGAVEPKQALGLTAATGRRQRTVEEPITDPAADCPRRDDDKRTPGESKDGPHIERCALPGRAGLRLITRAKPLRVPASRGGNDLRHVVRVPPQPSCDVGKEVRTEDRALVEL
jgi:hypothetical protein